MAMVEVMVPEAEIISPTFPSLRLISVAHPQSACRQAPTDQMAMAHKYPFLLPSQSTNRPAKRLAMA